MDMINVLGVIEYTKAILYSLDSLSNIAYGSSLHFYHNFPLFVNLNQKLIIHPLFDLAGILGEV